MRLYPVVPVKGQSFKGVKKVVVPSQSMTLQEIIKRFVRNEALPVSKEGVYEDRYDYDLEKLSKEDLTVQHEVIEEFKEKAKKLDEKAKKEDSEKKDAMKKAAAAKRAELLAELKATTAANSEGVKA